MPEDPAALHVVGVTATGRLMHTIRTPGAWTPFLDVFGPSGADQPQLQGYVTEVAAGRAINKLGIADPSTPVFPEALVVVVQTSTQPNPLLFYRYDTGQWLSMGTAPYIVGARRVAAACGNSYPSPLSGPAFPPTARLHLAWTGPAGQILATSAPVTGPAVTGPVVDIEYSTGASRGAFRVPALAAFDSLGPSTQSRLAGVTADGRMYQSIVTSTGWADILTDVETAGPGDAGEIVDVALAIANVPGRLDYYGAVSGDGRAWLAVHDPVTQGWTSWHNLEEADFVLTGNGVVVRGRDVAEFGTFERLALATTTEGLHVLGVTSNGQLWHQLQAGLSTQPRPGQEFRDVETVGVGADAGQFTAVAAA